MKSKDCRIEFALAGALVAICGNGSAAAAQLSPTPRVIIPPAPKLIAGPYNFCADNFSVRLKKGETIRWKQGGEPPLSYDLYSDGKWIDISRYYGPPPNILKSSNLRLPGSPFSKRVVYRPPGSPSSYGIQYLLYGLSRTTHPTKLLFFSESQQAKISIVERVRLGTLKERRCTPTWRAGAPQKRQR